MKVTLTLDENDPDNRALLAASFGIEGLALMIAGAAREVVGVKVTGVDWSDVRGKRETARLGAA